MGSFSVLALPKDRTSKKERKVNLYNLHADEPVREICTKDPYRAYRVNKYVASDVEIYEVLSTTSAKNAIFLLASGLRSREESLRFFADHSLEHLVYDHEGIVRAALERNIPAEHALQMMSFYGSYDCNEPHYIDALEANGVRAIREIDGLYYPSVPDRVMNQEIDLGDIRIIGATYLKKASRIARVSEQLKKIKAGKSPYDVHMMKKLLDKVDPQQGYNTLRFPDVLMMANSYGAETVLGLSNVQRSAAFATLHLSGTDYSDEQKAEILVLEDSLSRRMVKPPAPDEIIDLYACGASVREIMQGLVCDGLSVSQVIASKHGVKLNLSDGWL